jgi:hypothetical protein
LVRSGDELYWNLKIITKFSGFLLEFGLDMGSTFFINFGLFNTKSKSGRPSYEVVRQPLQTTLGFRGKKGWRYTIA